MNSKCLFFLFILCSFFRYGNGQMGGGVQTSDGFFLASKNVLMADCLREMNASESNATAVRICRCRVELLNGRYFSKEISKYQKKYKDSGVNVLIKEDTLLKRQVKECYEKESFTSFLKLPAAAQRFKDSCKSSFKRSLEEKYNETAVEKYCDCAVNILKDKKLTEKEFDDFFDINSLLYNEVNYFCGSPVTLNTGARWSPGNSSDVTGPETDTVKMIAIEGMQKMKIRIGDYIKVAMLDCGATDILVPESFMKQLLSDPVVSENINFIDVGKYELANGSSVECRRYKADKITLGKFQLNNVILASTEKNITILVGRTVLNKFRKWYVDNEKNLLVLEK